MKNAWRLSARPLYSRHSTFLRYTLYVRLASHNSHQSCFEAADSPSLYNFSDYRPSLIYFGYNPYLFRYLNLVSDRTLILCRLSRHWMVLR